MRRTGIWVGAIGVVAALTLGVAGWVVTERVGGINPLAAAEKACDEMESTESYDMTIHLADTPDLKMTLYLELSGDAYQGRWEYAYGPAYGNEVRNLQIVFDGKDTLYMQIEGKEWGKGEGDPEAWIPLEEALCPDIESAVHLGEETLDGVATTKYEVATGDKSTWTIWIDANGWLVQAEELAWEDKPSETTILYVISEVGEENKIVIPGAQ